MARYVLCVENRDYPASLEVRKVYRALSDPAAKRRGMIRVVDEGGETHLFPAKYFVEVEIPEAARRCFRSDQPARATRPRRGIPSRANLRASMPRMKTPSEALIREDREDR